MKRKGGERRKKRGEREGGREGRGEGRGGRYILINLIEFHCSLSGGVSPKGIRILHKRY